MMHILNGDTLVAEFDGNISLATWMVEHPETHDYVPDGDGFTLKFREPWRLIRWPVAMPITRERTKCSSSMKL